MSDFQGDLLLKNTLDGGDIELTDDDLFVSDQGFDTAIYLSLFGGNELDNGSDSTKPKTWWGNLTETDNPERKIISHTQFIITGLPATPANLNKLKEAIKADLQWMVNELIIDTLNITVTIATKSRVNIIIEGIKNKKKIFGTKFEQNWLAKLG